MVPLDQLATDRIRDERRDGDHAEERPRADADFPHIGDLSDEGGCEGDEGAGAEAEEGCEDDDGGVCCCWEPEGEDDDACVIAMSACLAGMSSVVRG